jgi:phosphoribosylaminoimidazole (AIR) synthetase
MTPAPDADQGPRNEAWVSGTVGPAAKRTQDNAEFWPLEGVGPFAAVLPLSPHGAVVTSALGPNAVAEASKTLRDGGCRPVAVLDYLCAKRYDNGAMREAFAGLVGQCLDEHVALVGGESSEHDNMDAAACVLWAVVIGVHNE